MNVFKTVDPLNLNKKPFLTWIWTALAKMTLGVGLSRFYLCPEIDYKNLNDSDLVHRRSYMFSLGASWVFALVWKVAILLILFTTSWMGLWTWLWSGSGQSIPPLWILTLGDNSLTALLLLSFLSGILGATTGLSGIGLVFVTLALFSGVLSVQGALLIIFAERLGIWNFILFKTKGSVSFKRDILIRTLLAVLFFLIQFFFGGLIIQITRFNLGFQYSNLFSRFFEFGFLYFWWAALESLFVLLVFHYYWNYLKRTLRAKA